MIPLAIEIYTDGHLDSQHEKVMSLKSKDQTIRGLATICEARQELERGHLSVSSSAFEAAGGSAIANSDTVARCIKKGFNHKNNATAQAAPGAAASQQIVAASQAKKVKQHVELDTECINFKTHYSKELEKVREQIQASFESCEAAQKIADSSHGVPQLNEYVALMKVRMNYMQIVAITAEEDDGGFARLGLRPFSLIDDYDFKFVKGVVEKFEGFSGTANAGSFNSDYIAKFSDP